MVIDQTTLIGRVSDLLTIYGQHSRSAYSIGHTKREGIAQLITKTQHALNPRQGDKAQAQVHITAALHENGNFRADYRELFTHVAIAEQLISQLPKQRRNKQCISTKSNSITVCNH